MFAYSVEEMLGIDPEIVVHRLNINTSIKPFLHEERHLGSAKAMDTELQRLLEVGFIRKTY